MRGAEQLAALADALNVTADYLLGRPDAKQPVVKGPPGKLRLAFEKAHKLQTAVGEVVDAATIGGAQAKVQLDYVGSLENAATVIATLHASRATSRTGSSSSLRPT